MFNRSVLDYFSIITALQSTFVTLARVPNIDVLYFLTDALNFPERKEDEL